MKQLLALALASLAVAGALQAQTLTPAQARMVGGCMIYPADNIWNTPINGLPVDQDSAVFINTIGKGYALHPDFGREASNGMPINVVDGKATKVKTTFEDKDDSDKGPYPVGSSANALVEGGPNPKSGDDHHFLTVVSAPKCVLYEMYNVSPITSGGTVGRKSNGTIQAYSGNYVDLTSNQLRALPPNSPMGLNSADAAGLEIMPALVRYDEAASGQINHALRFTLPVTRSAFVWPARHYASSNASNTLLPMGARIRLKASFNTAGYSQKNQAILNALKTYGAILADNGSPLFLSGTPDVRWDDDDLHNLGKVTFTDFEVVSMSAIADLEYVPNSGKVDPDAKLK
ncbi:hypothetical protein [Terriglobus roseus]|nr:hypothetical protein [Terriglobus roseus]